MSGNGVLVSIIIVNYNYARYVRDAILSAVGQSYGELDIVIVDDGSTDGSREIIEEFRDRARLVLQRNQGPTAAYNAGYAASRGELIMFLDADDILRPSAVEEVAAAWRPCVAKVQFSLEIIDAAGRSNGAIEPVYPQRYTAARVRREFADTNTYIWPPTSGNAFSRRFLEQVMPMSSERFRFVDGALSTVAPLFGDVHTVAKPLGFYRIHGNNLWALQGFSLARIRGYVAQRRCEIDYLHGLAAQRGHAVAARDPLDHSLTFLGYRLILAKLDRDPAARAVGPLRLCLRAWRCLSVADRPATPAAAELLWFVLVGLSFGGITRRLIEWRFDRSVRPAWVGHLVNRARARTRQAAQGPG